MSNFVVDVIRMLMSMIVIFAEVATIVSLMLNGWSVFTIVSAIALFTSFTINGILALYEAYRK